jgi:hypothetical protein
MRNQDPGLPGDIDNLSARPAKQYTLPQSVMKAPGWIASGLSEADLTFTLAEPSVAMEASARKFGKGDEQRTAERLLDMCLTTIGGQKVMLSQKRIDAWKNAIGPKGRKMVDAKFLELYQVSEADAEEMDESGKDVMV